MSELREGIDCTVCITPDLAAKLKAAGKSFVARYLVPEKYKWKRLTLNEAKDISDAGMDILCVFETTANRALSGFDGGKADGESALEEAKIVHQPSGSAIYFAVDFDVTKPQEFDLIEQYLSGAASAFGKEYCVGVYAEFTVIEAMVNRGAAKYFWQTYAWSAGKKSKYANVYQYKNGQTIASIQVDLNNSFGNEGFWNLRSPAPTGITKFKDVPAGHWAEKAIKVLSDEGIMTGYPDGTFGLGKPLTREELASVLVKFDAYIKEVK